MQMPARWLAGACLAAMAAGATARTPSAAKLQDTPKPGAYGRINVRGTPPPLIYAEPVLARQPAASAQQPVYLYVPPGQVRRWPQHCAKWNACERPVYFVRMDDSPSRLGSWKKTQRPQPAETPVLQALYRLTP
jgi:hypothetical protein